MRQLFLSVVLLVVVAIQQVVFFHRSVIDGGDDGDARTHENKTAQSQPIARDEHTSCRDDYKVFNRTFPGRFQYTSYPNVFVKILYTNIEKDTINRIPSPYVDSACAPGLKCSFSDRSWHEGKSWHDNLIQFQNSPILPNTIHITMESAARFESFNSFSHLTEYAGRATTDLKSEIPLSYTDADFSYENNELLKSWYIEKSHNNSVATAQIDGDDDTSQRVFRILHIASNCKPLSDRNHVVEQLMRTGLVDSVGLCMKNVENAKSADVLLASVDNNITWNEINRLNNRELKNRLLKKYAFTTAFENSYFPGYFTEKIWSPLFLGSVPIYLGGTNYKTVFPPDSAILTDDFVTADDLIAHIQDLVHDRSKYMKYHEWRKKDIPEYVKETWRFSLTSISCRICRWGAENLGYISKSTSSPIAPTS